ncbi:hypothetical protein SAMN05421755_10277 [Nitrosomonas sp. Nm33]|nr:hypothetical protein SAMN05421755_10277 [Nitrosomonas sp. Nm33]
MNKTLHIRDKNMKLTNSLIYHLKQVKQIIQKDDLNLDYDPARSL